MNGKNKKKHTREELDHHTWKWIKIANSSAEYVEQLKFINNSKFDGKIPKQPEIEIPIMPR
jgi:hypothetical protein